MNIGKKSVKLQIVRHPSLNLTVQWDTAGQERYRTITNAYYRGSDAIILVADITNKESFDNIPDWLGEVNKYTGEDVQKILLLNKSDFDDEKKQITEHDIAKFEKETGIICMMTSAKTGQNVDEAFLKVTKKLMEKKDEEEEAGGPGGIKKIGIRGKKSLFAGTKKSQGAMSDCCN